MTMITMRLLNDGDAPFLEEMLYQALYVPAGQEPFPRQILQQPEISRYVQGWGRAEDMGVLAIDESRPVGAAWLRLLQGQNHGYGYINDDTPELSVALLPEYRGQGIGRALLSKLIELAGQLYQQLGFVIIGQDGDTQTMVYDFGDTLAIVAEQPHSVK